MSESGRFDFLGALLAKNAKIAGNGQQKNASLAKTTDAKEGTNHFGEVFAGATPLRSGSFALPLGENVHEPAIAEVRPDATDGKAIKTPIEAPGISTIKARPFGPEAGHIGNPSPVQIVREQGDEHGDRVSFVEDRIAAREFARNAILPEKRAFNDFFTNAFVVDHKGHAGKFSDTIERAGLIEFAGLAPSPVSTVKLENRPTTDALAIAPSLEPRNGSLPSQAGHRRNVPGVEIVGAPAINRLIANDGASFVNTATADFVSGSEKTLPEFILPQDRTAEIRLTPSTTAVQPTQSTPAFAVPYNLAAVPATSQLSGLSGGLTLMEADLSFQPSASIQPGAPLYANGPTIIAASNAPTFANMAGVLPQIQAAISARNGRDLVEVRLDPPELGRIRIEFNVEGAETLKAVIGAERPETLDHLKRNIADLEQQLKQAGFGSLRFEFLSGGERSFAQERADSPFAASENEAETNHLASNTIYLSLRENAQLDLLV